MEKHMKEAAGWFCECGERCDPCSPSWRWNGSAWEHHHGYPIGHVIAQRHTRPFFKLSPELVDGDHWTPVDTIEQVLTAVRAWCEEFRDEIGEEFSVEIIDMTDAEVEALSDI